MVLFCSWVALGVSSIGVGPLTLFISVTAPRDTVGELVGKKVMVVLYKVNLTPRVKLIETLDALLSIISRTLK